MNLLKRAMIVIVTLVILLTIIAMTLRFAVNPAIVNLMRNNPIGEDSIGSLNRI